MQFLARKAAPAAIALIIALSTALVTMPVEQAIAGSCPSPSGSLTFENGQMNKFDKDSPVRPTPTNPDKNLKYRESPSTIFDHPTAWTGLAAYTTSDTTPPPQIATIFSPARTPGFTNNYLLHNWNWIDSNKPGSPGTRGSQLAYPQSRAIGMVTTPGEPLRAPCHGYNLGSPWGTGGYGVLYADSTSITLVATRYDSVAKGYTLHILGVNVNPTLVSMYNTDDNSAGARYHNSKFNLPGLKPGQIFGTAAGSEIIVALRDNGSFMDTGDSTNWWRIRTWPASPVPGPSLISPANHAVTSDNTPDFSWSSMPGADNYTIDIDNNSDFSSITQTSNGAGLTYTATTLPDATYSWRVTAFNGVTQLGVSTIRTFTVDLAPPKVTTVAPNGTSNNTTPTFQWNASDTPDAETYTLSLTGPETHSQDFAEGAVCAGSTCSVVSPWTLVANGVYTFTVKAANSHGDHGASAGRTFTLDTIPLAAPTPTSPKNNMPNWSKPTVKLRTRSVRGSSLYEFDLETVGAGLDGASDGSYKKSTLSLPLGTNFGTYIWAARTVDPAGNRSAWSTPFRFTYTLMTAPKIGRVVAKTARFSFSWKAYSTSATYVLAYSQTPDPTDDCGVTDVCIPTNKAHKFNTKDAPTPLTPGTWYWTVQVNGGTWMPVWSFTVPNP